MLPGRASSSISGVIMVVRCCIWAGPILLLHDVTYGFRTQARQATNVVVKVDEKLWYSLCTMPETPYRPDREEGPGVRELGVAAPPLASSRETIAITDNGDTVAV